VHVASTGISASHLVTRSPGFFIRAVSFFPDALSALIVCFPLAMNESETALQLYSKSVI